MPNQYVVATRGIMTSSKLKDFIKSPELYKVKYEDELELEEEDKRHFVVGSAFDYLVCYWSEAFLEKYYIDEWYVVDQLREELIKLWKIDPKEIGKMKLPELRALYYWDEDNQKIRLTPAEWKQIMGMYREAMRQPACDMWGEYLIQHTISAEYNGIKVWWSLDRYSPDKALIRDRKTTGRIDRFAYDLENSFDYVLSMSFYFLLVFVNEKRECDVVLDVIGKSSPYPYVGYELDKKTLLKKLKDTILPALDFYVECKKNNERPPIDPITKQPIDRRKLLDNPYYPYLESTKVDYFIAP